MNLNKNLKNINSKYSVPVLTPTLMIDRPVTKYDDDYRNTEAVFITKDTLSKLLILIKNIKNKNNTDQTKCDQTTCDQTKCPKCEQTKCEQTTCPKCEQTKCEQTPCPKCEQTECKDNAPLLKKIKELEAMNNQYQIIINLLSDHLPNPPKWWLKYKSNIDNGIGLNPLLLEIKGNGNSNNDQYLYLNTLKNMLVKSKKTSELSNVINELNKLNK